MKWESGGETSSKEGRIFFFLAEKYVGTGAISEINNPVNPGSTPAEDLHSRGSILLTSFTNRITRAGLLEISYETVVPSILSPEPLLRPLRAFILG